MVIKSSVTQHKNLRDFAYNTIRHNILHLGLKPGQKVTELELVDILKIGKTPIREALIQLAKELLVTIVPQSGTFISKINLNAVEEGHYLRCIIEEDIHVKAIASMSPESLKQCELIIKKHKLTPVDDWEEHWAFDELFHKTIYDACGKPHSFLWIQHINTDYNRIRFLALLNLPKAQQIVQEHANIIEAISGKDEVLVRESTRKHLGQVALEKSVLLKENSSFFV